ncbi:MAG: dUTP diphosphatase [Acutalibacteraceae bacterium]|nr:dUTP diphosphatase [Acutalibacteraceae bacterium]
MELKIKKVRECANIPTRATEGSAGMDLYACIDSTVIIEPGQRVTIPTGIAVSLSNNEYAVFIFARSGLGIKHGISLSNGVGVVDSDYRGEICVGLINQSDKSYAISPNDRIAQMVVMPVCIPNVTLTDNLNTTLRSNGGFGSTGK